MLLGFSYTANHCLNEHNEINMMELKPKYLLHLAVL